MTDTGPFTTIESAQEFLALLAAAIEDAIADANEECTACAGRHQERTVAAWRLVLFKMARLSDNVSHSRRLLEELRTLRNLLQRSGPAAQTDDAPAASAVAALWRAESPAHSWSGA